MHIKSIAICISVVITLALVSNDSKAVCKVTNDTSFTFVVKSGRTSNQRISAHTTTFVSAGRISGRSTDGATIGGYCNDEDELVIKLFSGVPVLLPR